MATDDIKPIATTEIEALPVGEYEGTVAFGPVPVAVGTLHALFEVDQTNVPIGAIVTIVLDESTDGGQSWHEFGSVTVDTSIAGFDPTKPSGIGALFFDETGKAAANRNPDYRLRGRVAIDGAGYRTKLTGKFYG